MNHNWELIGRVIATGGSYWVCNMTVEEAKKLLPSNVHGYMKEDKGGVLMYGEGYKQKIQRL